MRLDATLARALGAMLAGGLSTGCVKIGSTSYRAFQDFEAKGTMVRASEPVAPLASKSVRYGRRVAFIPPPPCDETDPDGYAETPETSALGLPCGALMAELEGVALDLGLEVLSWRELLGKPKPLAAAREAGLDAVFRLTEAEQKVAVSLTPKGATRYNHDGERIDEVEPETQQRCDARFAEEITKTTKGAALTLELVDTARGDRLWAVERHISYKERADGTFRVRVTRGADKERFFANIGAPVALAAGSALIAAGFIVKPEEDERTPTTPDINKGIGIGFASAGLVLLIIDYSIGDYRPPFDEIACDGGKASWIGKAGETAADRERIQRGLIRQLATELGDEIVRLREATP